MKYRKDLTQEELKNILVYDEDTGVLTRISTGKVGGSIQKTGYISISIRNEKYYAHRIAYLYVMGVWPENHIDHINMNRSDNRWVNLRPATHKENLNNRSKPSHNTSGFKGVSFRSDTKKWEAYIHVDGKKITLGSHKDKQCAVDARIEASKKYHGEFARA